MDKKRTAIFKLSLAMLIFGSIGIFRRGIPLSSSWIACIRGVVGTLFLMAVVLVSGKKMNGRAIKRNWLPLLISGAAIGFNWILLFEAYNFTSIAVATLCYYMAPVLVIIVSPFLLKERLTLKKAACVVVAVAGMLLVSGIFEAGAAKTVGVKGIVFGLGAAVLYATAMLTNKFLKEISSYDRTIMQLGIAALVVLPYAYTTAGVKEFSRLATGAKDFFCVTIGNLPFTLVLLAIVGIVHTGIAYWLYFGSMDDLSGQTIAVCSYIDPAFAVVFSVVGLGEETGFFGILGAVLILGSMLISEWKGKEKE